MKRSSIIKGLTGLLFFISLWEFIARSGIFPPYYLPPFTLVFYQLFNASFLSQVLGQLGHSLWRAALGYFIATLIAVPLGILIGRSHSISVYLEPVLEFFRPLPSSAIIPVAILFLQLGWKMIVFVVAFGATWPILVATVQGARNVDPVMIDTGMLLRLSPFRMNCYIVLPSSLPYIMAGLRTSLAVSLILAVTAEMLAGSDGIGFYILDMERAFQTTEMYAGIMIIGLAGLILNKIFVFGERRIIYWTKHIKQ